MAAEENKNPADTAQGKDQKNPLAKEARLTDSPGQGFKSSMEDTQEREISNKGGKASAERLDPQEKELKHTKKDEIPPGEAPGTDKADPTDTSGAINNELNRGEGA